MIAAAVRAWCESELAGQYQLEVLDLRHLPPGDGSMPVLATPALALASPCRVVVGDLSDVPAAMAALGLVRKPA